MSQKPQVAESPKIARASPFGNEPAEGDTQEIKTESTLIQEVCTLTPSKRCQGPDNNLD